mmetsp:Transcript_50106/g.156820  ORF Transcript_50106/g.156820 Transcript_50106/m.156820 type:complete len:87 (+) Transcript_50106:1396-1656(+)
MRPWKILLLDMSQTQTSRRTISKFLITIQNQKIPRLIAVAVGLLGDRKRGKEILFMLIFSSIYTLMDTLSYSRPPRSVDSWRRLDG